jgi:predicted ATP-grasp superfamily ATP-dependent carboligase
MPVVIVTNAQSRMAYNVVKSLGQKGIDVYTSDFVRSSMSFTSRYSKGHFLYPSPFKHPKEFIDCIIENVIRLKADVVIPVYEETFVMAKFKQRLARYVKTVLPDYDQILMAHNKDKWEHVAEKLNIAVPRTYSVEVLRKQAEEVENIRYPALIKPKQGGGGWAIVQVDSPDKLNDLLSQGDCGGLPWERFFVQERIEGETHCVAMLFCNGEYRAKVTYEQVRTYPVINGQATLRVSLRNEEAEGYLQKMLEYLRWHGICQADFIVDKRTGVSYLIDINPRFWGSLIQGIASGVDFPHLLYKIATEGDVEPSNEFKTGIATRWLGGDIKGFFALLRASKEKVKFLRNYVIPTTGVVCYDDFCLEDPLPFFTWSLDALYRILKHRSLSPATHDSMEGIWE